MPHPPYAETLYQSALADERILVLTAENRAAIRSLPDRLGSRFVDVGIAEQTMVGMAAGLALRGRVPVCHALAAFLTMRAFEFIRTDVGIAGLPVKLVGSVPGFLSEANGPTHQALEDVALMRGVPGVQVFCPADEADLVIGLPHLLGSPQPVYIRHNHLPPVIDHDSAFEIGRAEVVCDGSDVTILVYGALFAQVWQAARALQADGLSPRVLNLRTVKPVDEEAVIAAASETRLLVTVEDHFLSGGLHTIVAELMGRYRLATPLFPIALHDRWFRPALLADVLVSEGFTGQAIAEAIRICLTSGDRRVKNHYARL
jgi:transketolase